MKSFEEAIRITCLATKNLAEERKSIEEYQLRNNPLVKEIGNSNEVVLISTLMFENMRGDYSPKNIKFHIKNALAQGVLIGIEMEKQELL